MPRVSVVIATYNHASFVVQAVESVLSQTYPDTELIVVDDGSTDRTARLLDPYRGRIRYLYQQKQGVSAARNAGLSLAEGEYVLFLDADDWIPSEKLALQVQLLEEQLDLGLVYCGFQYVDERGTRSLGEMRPNKQGCLLEELLLRTVFFPPGAALIRRTCLERVGRFDESLSSAADTDLWARLAKAGFPFGYIDRILLYYRVVPGSMSSQVNRQAADEFARLDGFFANPGLSANIQALRARAYSALHCEFAAKHYHAGQIASGQDHMCRAIAAYPSLLSDQEWVLEWLAGFALGPRVEAPHDLLDSILNNLPPDAGAMRVLRRQAHGRYHVAAAFSACQSGRFEEVRSHIVPAIRWDPSILWNRGFVRIAAQSLFARVPKGAPRKACPCGHPPSV